ncbi:AAA family ATPase [Nostoc sp. CHAB 5784]|uniref:DEAD/DEAH box helicase n=1 Tax=Nostoc mirabile TaxID=2907820 RepID=UPI001E507D0A|nr:AAA domain-containing protein [Nostoc mirabile]MCC5669620.1 AAA family ATPase [Nostoc mirabile CHAB5784]
MSETWGYNYIKAASANFISLIEGADVLNAYPDYWQRHARADELISHLLGSEPCIFYIRRQEPGRNSEYEEKWKLIVATDRDDFQLPLKLEERQQTLQLSGIVQRDGTGNLVLTAINLVDLEQGRVDSFSLPRLILLQRAHQNNIGIPETAFAEIATMPVCSSYVPTYDQIQGWEAYLGIQRRIAENRQFYVPVISYNYSASAKHITFTVDATLATSNGSISITLDEFWKRAEKVINEPLKFLASSAEIRNRRAGKELGKIESVRRNHNQITLKLEPDIAEFLKQDNFALPETILLFFKDTGSLAQIQWQGQALRNLRLGYTHNFNLSKFFFEASQARPLEKTIQLAQEDLFLGQANDSQLAAVEAVLAAEDLILLQGPPGTGKTTVITEICYQVALKGGRTLIASQANLAVDNALSRLSHHPVLRPVRDGNTGNVSPEGEPFLSGNVINRWTQNTSAECENRLSKHQKLVQGLRPLLTSLDQFQAYLQIEESFLQQQHQLLESKNTLELECQRRRYTYAQLEARQHQIDFMQSDLQKLIEANSVFLANQQIKIEQLKNRKTELASALRELEDWQLTANSQIYEVLKQCLQQRHPLAEDLIPLPLQVQTIALEVCQQPWKQYIDECQLEINELIFQLNECDEVYKVGNKIYWLLLQNQKTLINIEPFEAQVSQIREQLATRINSQHHIQAINLLHNYSSTTIVDINQSSEQRKIYIAAIKLEAIKREYEQLIQNNQARDWESKLYKLIAKVSSGITESAKDFFNKLQTETEQMLLLTSVSQDNLQATLAPLSVLSTINSHINSELESIREVTNKAFNEVTELSNQVREIEKQIEELELNLNNFRHWWLGIYQKIPNWLKPNVDDEELFNLNFLRNIPINFELWQQELEQSEAYLNQWEPTIQKWIEKLRQPSDLEYEALRKKYLDNANVIGVTCMKAARCNYLQQFGHFDVVIIDEVSKSIPPELLIPTLKGKKIVMIGDYRQLPPILDEENLDELAEELSIPIDNLQFLEQSWFQLQFQAAQTNQASITRRLNIQYRMHPQIMEAINQFYDEGDGGLSCGLTNPDIERAHNLAGLIIGEDNHIMWAAIPTGREFHERRDGTSYYNDVEIRKIKALCKQMEESWVPKVAQGLPKKEIGIITFYGAQLRRIESCFSANNFPSLNIRTGTVDRFQGMEKPVIIVSMVRNNLQSNFGFAQTPERVNVAFSRAKELLIIVGCHDLFTQLPIYQKVSQVVHEYRGFIDVSNL